MAHPSISFSEVPQYSDRIPQASSHHHSHHLVWTPAHEERLKHAQAQLAAAQANWSEEQELWIDEVRLSLLFWIDPAFSFLG